ncbi:unnamed protein product [Bemisia tabaci]|uniref:Uncharacterized protein n=1 Tax=Bemisia tabaci TaxID=7038 RepID=A0A9P0CD40_BEMTA|nr:unnamed protein product [Bemisia tabaci]
MSFRSFFSPKMAPIERIHLQTQSKEECEVRNQDPDEQLKKLGSLQRERSSSSDSNECFKSFFAPKMAPIKKIRPETVSQEKCKAQDHHAYVHSRLYPQTMVDAPS